jgi:hypothetical protein
VVANTIVGDGSKESSKITTYQKLVLLSAFFGWIFDSMDLNIFVLILFPCIKELIQSRNLRYAF